LEADIVEIRQKSFKGQDLSVVEALDYAESEVQDLRSCLEKVQERQRTDADEFQRQQASLLGLFEQLQASHEKQCAEIQSLQRQLLDQSEKYGAKLEVDKCVHVLQTLCSQVDKLEAKLVAEQQACKLVDKADQACTLCSEVDKPTPKNPNASCVSVAQAGGLGPKNLGALRAQVDKLETKLVAEHCADLEVKLVAEQTRTARAECASERALQSLQSRIDALETQHKWICKLDEPQDSPSDPLQDLQAVVDRQLLEEHAETGATPIHVSSDKQVSQLMALAHQVCPGPAHRPRRVLSLRTDIPPVHDEAKGTVETIARP